MKKLIAIIILISSIYLSCQKKDAQLTSNPVNKLSDDNAYFGIPFELQVGQCINLSENLIQPSSNIQNSNDSIYTICFLPGVYDRRCHLSVCDLCFGTYAHISINFITSQHDTNRIKLEVIGCMKGQDYGYYVDTLGFRISLLQLNPYPDSLEIRPEDYIAKLLVEKL